MVRTHSSFTAHFGGSLARVTSERKVMPMIFTRWLLLPLFAMFCLLITTAQAQLDQGTITGTVTDQQGAAVPGAEVVLLRPDTGFSLTSKTDGEGSYVFSPIKIGTYSVTISAPGFATTRQDGLQLHVSERLGANIKLALGAASDTVTVSASQVPLLQTEESSTGMTVGSKVLTETPLNGRNFVFIAQLAAGVNQASGTRGQGKGDFNANGQRAEQNNFILDGVDNNSNSVDFLNGAGFVVKPPPEALAEFKVQTSSYSAELGHSAGAVINASIKSGSNQFHGDFWEYWRNDKLNAKDFNALTIPKYRQNQFGGTIGGPIIRNKLFFFGDVEALRIVFGNAGTYTVPTQLMRQGNFSELLNTSLTGAAQPTTLYTPNSAGVTPLTCNGQQNVLCANQINATAQRILNLYPLPNTNQGRTFNNYVLNRNFIDNTAQWDGRLDWNISPKDQTFLRMSYSNEPGNRPAPFGDVLDGGGFGDSGRLVNKGENFAFSETHIFSSTLTNEARFGYNYGHFAFLQPSANVNVAASLGLGGIPFSALNGGLPNTNISGISRYGSIYNTPGDEYENVFQILDNVTKVLGQHTVKVGVNFQRVRFSTFQPTWPKGTLSYNGTFTGRPGVSFTGSGVADYLTDNMNSATLSTIATTDDVHWYRSGYFQDDWKASSKLTLNLGLRYDFFAPYYERHDQQANFHYLTRGVGTGTAQYLLPAGTNTAALAPAFLAAAAANNVAVVSSGNRALVNTQKVNFAPRAGFAYSVTDKTVIRGGAGIFYGGLENLGYSPNLGVNYPFTFNSNFIAPSCTAANTAANSGCRNNGITLASGFSNAISTGLNNLVATPSVNGSDTDVKTAYSIQYNLSIQRALSNTLSLTVAYVGTGSRHLAVISDPNPSAALAVPGTNVQSLRPFPRFASGYLLSYTGASSYNGLQVTATKRFADGLNFSSTYTWSHSLDNAPTSLGQAGDNNFRNPLLIPQSYEWANSPSDTRHRATFNGNYQLPFGVGRKHLNHPGVLDEFVGGWALGATWIAQTGYPFSVGPNISTAAGGSATALRISDPNQPGGSAPAGNSGVVCPTTIHNKTNWYNPCAFTNPLPGALIASRPGGLVTDTQTAILFLGRGRNQVFGPGFNRTTATLFKNFHTFKEQYLQVRGEVFNVFNTPAYGQPSGGINSNSGQITSYRSLGAFSPDARYIQLALKYSY